MKLFKHQEDGVDFIISRGGIGALYFSCGLGKTLMALEIFKRLKENRDLKLLVVCPLTLIKNAWIDDIKKFTTFTYQNLHDKNEIKNIKDVDIYLFNYEILVSKDKQKIICSIANKQKSMLVVDESSRIKNHSAITTKTIVNMADLFEYRILLSGSPAPNGEEEYYAQMKFLDKTIFPTSFYTFRSYYFHLQRGKHVIEIPRGSFITKDMARKMFSQGFKYAITPNKRIELMEKIKPYVMFKDLRDCVDLPESTEITRKFSLSDEQDKQYKSMKNELVAELKGEVISAPLALTKINKLRQITSGFMITHEGKTVDFTNNSKLDELKEVLEEIGDNQAIIWTFFIRESEMIKKVLGDNSRVINGTVSEEEKNSAIDMFKKGEIKYLIANPQSIAHGVTLVNCNYSIYFSLSYSHEQHYQSIYRIIRIGQKKPCFYIYLLAEDKIDEIILDVVKNKAKEEEIVKRFLCEMEEN